MPSLPNPIIIIVIIIIIIIIIANEQPREDAEKNNDSAKVFVSLKQNNSEGFIGAPQI